MMATELIAEKVARFSWDAEFACVRQIAPLALSAGRRSVSLIGNAPPLPVYFTSAAMPKTLELTMNGIERVTAEVAKQFAELTAQWKKDTRHSSMTRKIVEHRAYRQIVAMGSKVVPFILADLEKTNAPWFTALREISGENAVPFRAGGTKIKEMVAAWIAWGKAHGYRW
jgi:hypothetical protein